MHRALLQLLAALRRARLLGVDGRDVVPRGVESGERRHREGRRSHEGDAHGEGLWRRMGGCARISLTPIVTPDLNRGDDGKGYCAPIAQPLPRSEERLEEKACVSKCSSRGSRFPQKKKRINNN